MASSLPILLFAALFYVAVSSPVFRVFSVGIPPKAADVSLQNDQKVTVHNRAGDKRNIWVHCFSGDDDLGVHLLYYWQAFVMKFHPNFFGGTEFFCTVTWNNIHPKGSQTHHTIIVFNQEFDDDLKCGKNGESSAPYGCTYHIGMKSFSGPDGINPWNHLSKRLIH